ncbi:hypothetical protein EI94DRAFT_1766556 [Lactarius quietus]|nr:hypothetical protein EI94DRAFT_1766556 [Lactarius quietus]
MREIKLFFMRTCVNGCFCPDRRLLVSRECVNARNTLADGRKNRLADHSVNRYSGSHG